MNLLNDVILTFPFIIFLMGVSFFVQHRVKSIIKKYHTIRNLKGMTGYDLAVKMLQENGVSNVSIQKGQGKWVSDFYDPTKKLVNLSPQVYSEKSVTALAIAAHEVGHAIQDNKEYFPMKIRSLTYPIAHIGSWLGPILLMAGMFLQFSQLFEIGIYFYAASVLFTVLNLPVEFDASARAKAYLHTNGLVSTEEHTMVQKLLWAAAMTYVMAAMIAAIELLRMVAFSRR